MTAGRGAVCARSVAWAVAVTVALALAAAACGSDQQTAAIGVDSLVAASQESATAGQWDDEDHHHTHDEADTTGYQATDLSMINVSGGEVPDVDMVDVSTTATVNLQSLTGSDKPLLFWFWSPH